MGKTAAPVKESTTIELVWENFANRKTYVGSFAVSKAVTLSAEECQRLSAPVGTQDSMTRRSLGADTAYAQLRNFLLTKTGDDVEKKAGECDNLTDVLKVRKYELSRFDYNEAVHRVIVDATVRENTQHSSSLRLTAYMCGQASNNPEDYVTTQRELAVVLSLEHLSIMDPSTDYASRMTFRSSALKLTIMMIVKWTTGQVSSLMLEVNHHTTPRCYLSHWIFRYI